MAEQLMLDIELAPERRRQIIDERLAALDEKDTSAGDRPTERKGK
jgi:hypothetical protein